MASQQTEIQSLRFELQKSIDQNSALANENELLLADLTLKQREYLKLVNDCKQHPNIGQEGNDPERIHLLTEENHILFQQITLLRAHTDHLMLEYGSKTEEAASKITRFDQLQSHCDFQS